jgi:hypothetical protein
MPADDLVERIGLELQASVAPLTRLVSELDEAIAGRERELVELRELRRNVKRVLGPLEPAPKPPAKNEKLATSTRLRHAAERAEKKRRTVEFVRDLLPVADITATGLLDDPEGPNSNGDPQIGRQLMVELLAELRDDGLLRLDRVAQGGQQVYRLVTHE